MAGTKVRVWSPDAVIEAVASASPTAGPHILVVGQWPHEVDKRWAERIGVLDVAGRPRLLLDAWVHRESIDDLCTRLRCNTPGGWDVMFATSWSWAWGGTPFSLYSQRGVAVRVLGPRRVVLGSHEHEVERVCAEVNRTWTVHRVGLVTSAGQTLWIARRVELFAILDLTYDGINLLADAAWAEGLGKELAGALGVPYVGNDPAIK